jgi:hypothetical protein
VIIFALGPLHQGRRYLGFWFLRGKIRIRYIVINFAGEFEELLSLVIDNCGMEHLSSSAGANNCWASRTRRRTEHLIVGLFDLWDGLSVYTVAAFAARGLT